MKTEPVNFHAPDLTLHPPRSPRVRLGGYVIFARMLDKCRATLAGRNGEYHFDCPLDAKFLSFVGIEAEALKAEVAQGRSDAAMLAWVTAHAKTPRTPTEIALWSTAREHDVPLGVKQRAHMTDLHTALAAHREDIGSWFELHDLDDFVTFGGKA
jgi:hypothetical protein